MQGSDTNRIQLDWYNVRYRTLWVWGICLVLGLAGGGIYFYYQKIYLHSPQGQARYAIGEAEEMIEQSELHAREDRLKDLHDDARRFLDKARRDYSGGAYQDARVAAIRSQNFSRRLMDTARSGETAAKEVRFYKIEGDTKVKRAGSFIWERADAKLPLSVGDQIKTASNATAQIIYFDGTITTIKPRSLLEIKELYEHPTTKVRKVREKLNFGGVSSTLSGGNAAGSYHEVTTDTMSARAHERSEIEIGYDKEKGKTEVRVHRGKARIVAGKREFQVSQSEMVALDRNQRLVQRGHIPKAPDLLQPIEQKVFVYGDTARAVTKLSWRRVGVAESYRLQISRRSLLGELLLDKGDVRTTSVKLPRLNAGSYYWRVAAVNSQGVESAFSETRKFKIVSSQAFVNREDKTPPPIEIKDFLVFSYQVIINGKTEPGAVVSIDGRRIDVYDDGNFTAVIKLKREGRNVLKIVAQDLSGNETQIRRTAYVEAF
ncbi:MAG: FecR domain-containing protein [Acidobacteriota bacterium]